jgi:circadian clock protein KaiB
LFFRTGRQTNYADPEERKGTALKMISCARDPIIFNRLIGDIMPGRSGKNKNKLKAAVTKISVSRYILKLYITGLTPRSTRAVLNTKRLCDEYLNGRYDLEIIDIYQQPVLAKMEQLIAAPTLVKTHPLPLKKFIGDMTDTNRILLGLDLSKEVKIVVAKN